MLTIGFMYGGRLYIGQGVGQMRTDPFSLVPDTTQSTLIASSSTVLLLSCYISNSTNFMCFGLLLVSCVVRTIASVCCDPESCLLL